LPRSYDERSMSWNDTASTLVELQSALHFAEVASESG
jgi:hypothetical protein